MEIQWPLILFTTLLSWSAGLFATQCYCAMKQQASKAQKPALLASVVLLVLGGIAVFFHLGHWERIFNGFGHITSGITQELIAIVVLLLVMVVYFVYLRKNEEMPEIPSGLSVIGIVVSVVLIVVMGHSYMVASLPTWNSFLQVLSLIGAAVALGVTTMTVLAASKEETTDSTAKSNMIAQLVNAVCLVLFLIAMQVSAGSLVSVQYWFDLAHPTLDIAEAGSASLLSGAALLPTIISVVAAIAGVASACIGKNKADWKKWGTIGLVCVLVSAIALRATFYAMGVSVFPFF